MAAAPTHKNHGAAVAADRMMITEERCPTKFLLMPL
jgi:hypothetical protein